jgi:hypothetical protein
VIRVVCHVTGGSDARTTEVSIELGDRDAPDAVPRLVAALRAEVDRRRVGVEVAPFVMPVEVPKPDAAPEAEAPKPDA